MCSKLTVHAVRPATDKRPCVRPCMASVRACAGGGACAYADQREEVNLRAFTRWAFDMLRGYMRAALNRQRSLAASYSRVAASDAGVSGADALAWYYELRHGELPAGVRLAARELHCDAETDVFLESCDTSFCSSFAAYFLRFFFSVTDTNAILRRGQMFVLSSAQLRDVLAPVLAPASVDVEAGHAGGVGRNIPTTVGTDGGHIPGLRLLDVGAGDGGVTAHLAKYFDHVTVTEVSAPMVRRLRERGYAAHHTAVISSDIFPTAGLFDVVSIFNVLDRCDNPRDLLADAIRLLKPGTGRLLMAVVLPFSEFVEDGTERRAPHGMLPMRGARCGDGASFEHSLSALLMRVFLPMGLCVERIAKVPYLCRGDMRRPYYVLADAILVFRYSPAEAEAQRTASLAHAVNEQGGRVPAAPVMPPTLGALGSAPTLASAAASSRAKAAAASAALARPLDTASLLRELPDD